LQCNEEGLSEQKHEIKSSITSIENEIEKIKIPGEAKGISEIDFQKAMNDEQTHDSISRIKTNE